MKIEIKAPTLPESVPDGTIATWHKGVGETVKRDELLVDIETDKVVIEVVAPCDGTLEKITRNIGETIVSDELIGSLSDELASTSKPTQEQAEQTPSESPAESDPILSPAAKKLIQENEIDADSVAGTGKGGRITKEDVVNHLENLSTIEPDSATGSVDNLTLDSGNRVEERVPMSRLRSSVA